MKVFNSHPLSKAEGASRRDARKKLVDLGLIMARGDPRQVHHADGDATNNALHNLVAANNCWHKALHAGMCVHPDDNTEANFPSFAMMQDESHPLGARPVRINYWLKLKAADES
jgi:hypothetical protein